MDRGRAQEILSHPAGAPGPPDPGRRAPELPDRLAGGRPRIRLAADAEAARPGPGRVRRMRVTLLQRIASAAALIVVAAGPALAADDGASLFQQNCSACHQAKGEGVPSAFPPLASHKV